jgi:hypothetical protein
MLDQPVDDVDEIDKAQDDQAVEQSWVALDLGARGHEDGHDEREEEDDP